MGSGPLLHSLEKFADTGLQLRLPVDLVPSTQFSRLTNAIPIIEGEIRTREGLTLVQLIVQNAAVSTLERLNTGVTNATIADTIYPHGYYAGINVAITVIANNTGDPSFATVGTYLVAVQSVPSPTRFTFTPSIPVLWDPAATTVRVLAQAQSFQASGSSASINTLASTAISNIYRLNQALQTIPGDRLVAISGRLFRAQLPAGNSFDELVLPSLAGQTPIVQSGFSGRPLSIASFRFTLAQETWAIIADQNKMVKFRESGDAQNDALFFLLGNPVPVLPATATPGGAGLLDGDYDWLYTYFDGYVQTEGNPSPGTDSGTIDSQLATSQINPNPSKNTGGGFAYTNHAFTGVTNISGQGTATQDGGHVPASSNSFNQASCIWKGFASPPTTSYKSTLLVTWQVTINKPDIAPIQVQLSYSVDNGSSFTNFAFASATQGQTTSSVVLPLGTDLAKVQFQCWGFCNSHASGGTFVPGGSFTVIIGNIQIDCNLNPTSSTLTLSNQEAFVVVTDPGTLNDGRITAYRLYRRGGSLTDAYRLVGTYPLGTTLLVDNIDDTTLSTMPLLDFDNDAPVSSVSITGQPISQVWGPAGIEARLLGCGDPGRPEAVYFSKPGNADSWPPQNWLLVSDPGIAMVNGCVFNNQTFAFSRERIYQLVEGYVPGITFTPFVTPSAHGLFCPTGLAIGPLMFFVAKDGIYSTSGGVETSIVENDIKPLFPTYDSPGEDVNGYEAVDMALPDNIRLRYHNDELYFAYTGQTTGTRQMLIYDLLKKRWRAADYTTGISEVYSEPGTVSSLLMGSDGGGLYLSSGTVDPTELDVIEGLNIVSTVVSNVTLPFGTYYARVSRISETFDGTTGEMSLSNEFSGITVDINHGIGTTLPEAPEGTIAWRIYYGMTTGLESAYQEFPESGLTLSRSVVVRVPGTVGMLPTANADPRIAGRFRTGANDQGQPLNRKQYSNLLLDLAPAGSTVFVTPVIDGDTQTEATLQVTGSGRKQVPLDLSDYFAFNTAYEIEWQRDPADQIGPQLFQQDTLHFLEPVAVEKWTTQPMSFGFPGYMHIRDCYIAIRSTAEVMLTVVLDETVVQTYTLASTSGKRQKVYVQLASNKAKEYLLKLSSTAEFRTYDGDMEVRVKPWLSVLGYSVQKPFQESV